LIDIRFPNECSAFVFTTLAVISDILIQRENLSLQIEYVYVEKNRRGKGLAEGLLRQHITKAWLAYPELKKVQVQLFANNAPAIKLYDKSGFHVEKLFGSSNAKILDYLPHNEALLIEIEMK
jgi:ribosomal protein S18 acetylase RimI-like enzyme